MEQRYCVNCQKSFDYQGNGYCPECAERNRRAGLYDHINASGFTATETGEHVTYERFTPRSK